MVRVQKVCSHLDKMDLEAMYRRIPLITRIYVTGVLVTMLGCQLHLFNKFQLFFSWKLFWQEGQYWRLLTTYLYFGKLSLDTLFHLYFLLQYSQTLEDDSFRGRRADFLYFLFLSIVSMTVMCFNSDAVGSVEFIPKDSLSITEFDVHANVFVVSTKYYFEDELFGNIYF